MRNDAHDWRFNKTVPMWVGMHTARWENNNTKWLSRRQAKLSHKENKYTLLYQVHGVRARGCKRKEEQALNI